MRFGVRKKLILFYVVVALLPLLAATVSLSSGAYHRRVSTIAQSNMSLAQAEATRRGVSLVHSVELIQVAMREPTTLAHLRRVTPMDEDARRELDAAWPTLAGDNPRLRSALDNTTASLMRTITETEPRFGNIILADRFGQLVAASESPRHFDFGDDAWFRDSYAGGQGLVIIHPVAYHESIGGYGVAVSAPVGPPDHVLGVVRFVVKLNRWMSPLTVPPSVRSHLMLVGDDGAILYRLGETPLAACVSQWDDAVRTADAARYRMTDDELQAYAPVLFPETAGDFPLHAPAWWLVIHLPREQITGPIWRDVAFTLGTGLLVVAALFLLGMLLIERIVTRRLLKLHHATTLVGQGNLDHRVQMPPHRVFDNDELDQLAAGFNRMLDSVQDSTRELQSANKLKDNFIIIAGHELRTPLNYILNAAKIHKDSTDVAKLRQAMQAIIARGQRFNEIIQAMFKLMPNGLRPGNMLYGDVRIDELFEELRAGMALFMEQREQRLVVEADASLPVVRADREKLRAILENLLTNAAKFSPDGKTIALRATAEPPGFVTVSVQDEGPGIPAEEYEHLFKPFFTGGDPMVHTSNKYGIGLGLPIVWHFAHLHHGEVRVESSPLGSTFKVTLPVTPPEHG
ncbi:MAG: ATP-binding protein [Phycisphaerae bacterium]|nr:ATP-binding protein [Phycisphaerae bacterium]